MKLTQREWLMLTTGVVALAAVALTGCAAPEKAAAPVEPIKITIGSAPR